MGTDPRKHLYNLDFIDSLNIILSFFVIVFDFVQPSVLVYREKHLRGCEKNARKSCIRERFEKRSTIETINRHSVVTRIWTNDAESVAVACSMHTWVSFYVGLLINKSPLLITIITFAFFLF